MREDMRAGLALADEGLKALLEVAKRFSEVELQRTDLVPYGYAFSALVPIERTPGAKQHESARGSASDSGIAP
jgi:hypothetical protein